MSSRSDNHPQPRQGAVPERRPPRVLITTRDFVYASFLEARLRHAGMDVVSYDRRGGPSLDDIARTDVVLVETHGLSDAEWGLIETVREASPLTEIVAISSEAQIGGAVEALRSGVFAILQYPVSDDQLVAALTDACRRKRRAEERIRELH